MYFPRMLKVGVVGIFSCFACAVFACVGSDAGVADGQDGGRSADTDAGTETDAGIDPVTGTVADAGAEAATDSGAPPDLQTDPLNCGSLANECGAPRKCVGGSCARLVFVTSRLYAANLGGAAGAGMNCQADAIGAGLTGNYQAWISTTASEPATAFTASSAPYQLVDGTVVADSFAKLTTANLKHAINMDEFGTSLQEGRAWTDTQTNGHRAGANCSDFLSNDAATSGLFGDITATENWSLSAMAYCSDKLHLYCFEQ